MEDNSNSYGAFPAAILLIQTLKSLNNKKIQGKIGKFMVQYLTGFRQLKLFSNKTPFEKNSKLYMAKCWKNDFINRVDFHSEIDSILKNVLTTHYKIFVEGVIKNG